MTTPSIATPKKPKPTHTAKTQRASITLHPYQPKHGSSVTVELGDGNATPTATGGWAATQRPRRVSTTDYQGRDPISQDVPVVLGSFVTPKSVEADVRRLYGMMMDKVGDQDQPVVLRLSGMPIPFLKRHWVLNAITRGDEVRRASDGHLTRATMTLTFLEYVDADILVRTSPAKKSKSGSTTAGTKIYITKHGDTLEKIAAKEYGKASDWHKIADANGLRDGSKVLKTGTRLKVPKK